MSLMLARHGHRIRLLERRPDPRLLPPERGRSINLALAARGILALEHAGMLERVQPQMITMPGRMLHDEQQQLHFLPYGQNDREVIYAVSREYLNRILIGAAAAHPAIELEFNQRCIDFEPDTGMVRLRDERDGSEHSEQTEVLLAADGAGSSVRGALVLRNLSSVTEAALTHDYKELLIPAAGAGSGHDGYAFEPHALHIWPRGGFMLIALPNTDGSFTATLFLPQCGDNSFERLDSETAVLDFFRREFADAAAAIPDLGTQFAHHPQSRLGTVYCEGWQAGGRALLIGDAAHAIVPFHGQGLNCGFEDCGVLERLLADSADTKHAFAAFERERQPNTRAIAAMAIENYQEMRDDVRSTQFARRKALAAELERHFPGRFIPRYSMVTFHPEIPYAEAQRRGARQEQLLDMLSERYQSVPLPASAWQAVRRHLDEAGL